MGKIFHPDAVICCRGKEKLNRTTANLIVRKTKTKVKLQSYKCKNCGHWHVGGTK